MALTGKKKYTIIFGDEQMGEVYGVRLADSGDFIYEQSLAKKIKQGPVYRAGVIYIDRLGSAARPVGVPREYVGAPTKFSGTLSNDEVTRVSRLVKDKLCQFGV